MVLSDIFPLRRLSDLGVIGENGNRFIPVGFGTVTVEPLSIDNNKFFILADMPIDRVLSVEKDGKVINNYQWWNGRDLTGKVVAFIQFSESVVARKVNQYAETTGLSVKVLINNATVTDALNVITGDTYSIRNYPLAIHGLISEQKTRRALIASICESFGLEWYGAAKNLIFKYPDWGKPNNFIINNLHPLTAEAHLHDIINDITYHYAYDASVNRYTKSLRVQNADSIRLYGVQQGEINLDWVQDRQVAATAAIFITRRKSMLEWTIETTIPDNIIIDIGHVVSINHPYSPVLSGMVVGITPQNAQFALDLRGSSIAGRVEIVSEANYAALKNSQVIIENLDTNAVFTINDDKGLPMGAALVALNNGAAKTTNAKGQVSFPKGKAGVVYTLRVSKSGYEDILINGVWE